MTTNGHMKSLDGIQNILKKDVNTVGTREMSDEEYDREMVQIKVHLDLLRKLLKGSKLGRKVKWPILKLYARKLETQVQCLVEEWREIQNN